jgi:hypothetical protein
MVTYFCCFWTVVRQDIMAGDQEVQNKGSCSPHGGQEADREERGLGQGIPFWARL